MLAQKIISAIHLCRSLFSKEYHRTFENALILPHFNYLGTIYVELTRLSFMKSYIKIAKTA